MLSLLSRLFRMPLPPRDLAQVAVYQRGDRLLVAVEDQTVAGFWVARDRVTTLSPAVAVDEQICPRCGRGT